MGFDKLSAYWWDFWLIPYYKVNVIKGNKIVKVFNQKIVNSVKGSNIALIDKSSKLCWWITEDYIVHKARFIFNVDISNAVPLKLETNTKTTGDIIQKTTTIKKLTIDKVKAKLENKTGIPKAIVEIHFPSTLLYELIEAHFVVNTMAEPPSKWDELKWVFIVAIIAGAFLLWQLMASGVIGGGKTGGLV